ncbi:multicopper oxidase family protein [Catelliglobosispora koreensis]|uniref:multicopper oxidase family protein n=1 Tax=Catelliglobosispora koreensis TaxID=129052 RepID=UPI00037F01DF|nr:multicopper oxidase family protein [Catelliglobosispora koreensis]
MNGQQLIAADLLAAAVSAAAWLATAIAVASGRRRVAVAAAIAAVVSTAARVAIVIALAGHGWWFVQDKVTLALPLLGLAAVTAGLTALRRGISQAVVPLFMTGYAAICGLLFQFLWGYPASPAQITASLALVGAATAVTWWLRQPAAQRAAVLAGVGAAVLGLIAAALGFLPGDPAPAAHPHHTVSVADLRGPVEPAPGGTVKRYALTARQAEITLASGQKVAAWTFDGQVPGPALTASVGDLVEVTLTNLDIADGVTLHWHGYDVRNGEDGAPGVTQDEVAPGGTFVYRFRADQVGTYWYHTHQVSDRGVRLGLYGNLIVRPRSASVGTDLVLPVHTFDGVLAIGTHDGMDSRPVPAGEPVRLRLINTDNTPHRFTLSGSAFRVVAADGNDLNGPTEVRDVALRVAAGARYDIAFTMPSGPVALRIDDGPVGVALSGGASGEHQDTSAWPELDLTSYGTPASWGGLDARPDKDFALVLDRGLSIVDGKPMYAHTVNGGAYPNIPEQIVREGDLVAFTVVNRGFETHPWHLHGHRVLVLAKDGKPVTGSPLLLDTFDVRPGEVWRVAFRASNPGVWMNHCHNLTHADQGMALHLSYEGVVTPFHGAHGG